MSDRVQRRDNYADYGETGSEHRGSRRGDRTSEGTRGGCGCGGGGGCCCNMRAEAYGPNEDPMRQQRHEAARRRMEAMTQGECCSDQAVPHHRRRTTADEVADPDHHVRRHHRRGGHHQDNYRSYGGDEEGGTGTRYRVIGAGPRGETVNYDDYGQPRQQRQIVDYDRAGRPLDRDGRVIAGAPMQDSVIGYDQMGRTVDQYGNVIGSGGVRYDNQGRAIDRDGRIIGGRTTEAEDYERYVRDQYERSRYDRYEQVRYENERYRERQQVIGYDRYGRPVDQYGNVVGGAGRDPWSGNNGRYETTEDWYRRHPDRFPMDERIPGVWDPNYGIYGRDGRYGRHGHGHGRYGRDGVHVGIGPNGQFEVGVRTNGVDIDFGTGGTRIGRGNVYDYYRGRYGYGDGRVIRSGHDYNDDYGRYEDPNGRGGLYYRPGGQVYDYGYYSGGIPRYDSRYAHRHGSGIDIGIPLGNNGGYIQADVGSIIRMLQR